MAARFPAQSKRLPPLGPISSEFGRSPSPIGAISALQLPVKRHPSRAKSLKHPGNSLILAFGNVWDRQDERDRNPRPRANPTGECLRTEKRTGPESYRSDQRRWSGPPTLNPSTNAWRRLQRAPSRWERQQRFAIAELGRDAFPRPSTRAFGRLWGPCPNTPAPTTGFLIALAAPLGAWLP